MPPDHGLNQWFSGVENQHGAFMRNVEGLKIRGFSGPHAVFICPGA
jgi:hypothetical protein